MQTQRTQPRAAGDELHPTARDEHAADETLDRITRTRQDADTVDDAAAEQAWRQIARLAARLQHEAHTIVVGLEGGIREQRDRVQASLLHCPERGDTRLGAP